MNINIKPELRAHFWEEPPVDAKEQFWSLGQFKPKVQPGEQVVFRFDGVAVAQATCSRVEKPGREPGYRGWTVHWRVESFKDLRSPDTSEKLAAESS